MLIQESKDRNNIMKILNDKKQPEGMGISSSGKMIILISTNEHILFQKLNMTDIFNSTPNWSFTHEDELAETKLNFIQKHAMKNLPKHFYSQIYCHFDEVKKSPLYSILKTIPKAVLHHLHFDCCDDQEFYKDYIVNDPIVYLNSDLKSFKVGTKKQAEQESWVSMEDARKKFQSEESFLKAVTNLTELSKEEIVQIGDNQEKAWQVFEVKIANFFPLQWSAHIFRKYTEYIMRKFIRNGYDRIEFRTLLVKLKQYDAEGNFVKEHEEKKFMELMDEAYESVRKDHPDFSYGVVFFGLKFLPFEQTEKMLTTVLEHKWQKTIGIDFVQQQDPNGSLKPYDELADKILAKFPYQDIKKVYHAGETRDHTNKNVQIALEGGSVRIGHGINFVYHPHLLEKYRGKVCFEGNPVSNIILKYLKDVRLGPIPILLGLGQAVTLSPDDPGRFECQDTTMDYFVAFVSYNWSLKHLKLIAIHSINHAICTSIQRKQLLISFNHKWSAWVKNFLDS